MQRPQYTYGEYVVSRRARRLLPAHCVGHIAAGMHAGPTSKSWRSAITREMQDPPGPTVSTRSELVAAIEARLRRGLTDEERSHLFDSRRPSLLADRFAMPDVARELADSLIAFLERRDFPRLHRLYLSDRYLSVEEHAERVIRMSTWSGGLRIGVLNLLAGWLCLGAIGGTPIIATGNSPAAPAYLGMELLLLALSMLLVPCFLELIHGLRSAPRHGYAALLDRLVSGDDSLSEIFRYTPFLWRNVFMGGPRNDIKSRLRLIVSYADWYFAPPKTHIRWSWIMASAAAALIPAAVFMAPAWREALYAVVVSIPILASAHDLFDSLKMHHALNLLKLIRERFGVQPDSDFPA